MSEDFITDKETKIEKNPRLIYKLTYDEFENCKKLQGMLFSDMTEKDVKAASDKIQKIVKAVFPEAELRDLKSDDPKMIGWEIAHKKGRPFLYIYMSTENMRPILIDQMRFDITEPGSIFHY